MARQVPVARSAGGRAARTTWSKTWYPLGYNIRPRRLHAIARESVARFGGELPSDDETLRSFKGIGPYTAGALMSFAFRKRAPILDTNVARVLFRVFVGRGDPKAHAMRKHLWAVSGLMVPHKRVFDFNQAIMDFGAMVCTARRPKCDVVPDGGHVPRVPVRPAPRRSRTHMTERARIVVTAAVIERDGAFLLTRRLDGTHLAGHWEFPGGKRHAGETLEECLAREIREELDADIEVGPEILATVHDYPERSIELRFFRCVLKSDPKPDAGTGDALGGASRPARPSSFRRRMTNWCGC